PVIMDDSALQALIGPIRKTSYQDGIRQTLAAAMCANARLTPASAS
ncbi:MAG TPA: epimerase, partial [Cupriavidus sp.]|nr:epimerase [Cupriavidus sp.]